MIPPDIHTTLSIQKGGKDELHIIRPKLTYTGLAFNTYDLTLNIQLPPEPDMGIVCVNRSIQINLSGNKSILEYGDIKPTCEINTFPNLPPGLGVYPFSNSRIYELEYYWPGDRNMFSATGIHRPQTISTDLWEFNFFLTQPADDVITDTGIKTLESKSLLTTNPMISNFINTVKQQEATLLDRGNIETVLGLIPDGFIQITIKNLKVNPNVLDIKAKMLTLDIKLSNDNNAASARMANSVDGNAAMLYFLKNTEKYNEMISDTTIGTTLNIKNPITSQTDILTKFGRMVGKTKALYQQLYMYFFMGINYDTISNYKTYFSTEIPKLCTMEPEPKLKQAADKSYIDYSEIFDHSRIDMFIYLFTKIMNMLIDQDITTISMNAITTLFEKEIELNAEYTNVINLPTVSLPTELGGGSLNSIHNSQEGGGDDFDHLACAKMVPMQISKLGKSPNDMVVTVSKMNINVINKGALTESTKSDSSPPPPPDISSAPVQVQISVGDAIRFVKDGEVVYGIICGFKSGKKKYLNGKIESNTNIEDYWESAKTFTGTDGIANLDALDINEVVSIVNLRGIIYVQYEYDNDIGYGYCPDKARESTGKIIFDCNNDKEELSMLPNGYNPSAASVAQKTAGAIFNTFKLGKSTPFGIGSYSDIRYSLRSYMTLDKVTPPKNFTEFVKELKIIRQPGVNSKYIQQLGGLINKHSLNDDCGRYGMKIADIASSQTAANFLNKVNATTRNYAEAMRGVFDMKKNNNFIVKNLLQINLTPQELKDTIYGADADQSNLALRIPKLIYGLMLRSPDYVTSMKLIFSALSDISDEDIQGKISGIKGAVTVDRTNLSVYSTRGSLGGGAASGAIKQLIDALIDVIKKQRLLRPDIIDNLSSACESAETAYNVHEDSNSFKAELGKSLTPPPRPSRTGVANLSSSSAATTGSSGSASSGSASSGSASSSLSTSFNNLASRFMGTSGEAGNISSMGSSSCGDAKVMCDENGIIQVQINLQDLLNNCFSSNGETGGTIVTPSNFTPGNGNSNNDSRLKIPNLPGSQPTKPPANTTPPTISGGNKVGSTLTVSNGFWDESEEQNYTYEYQWYRDGEEIPDAKTNKYKIVDDDIGKKITCKVTAINKDVRSDAIESGNIINAIAADSPPFTPDNTESDTSTIDSVRAAYTKYYGLYGKVAAGGGEEEGEEYGGGGYDGYDSIQEGGTSLTNYMFKF